MHNQEAIDALNEIRLGGLRDASQTRNVDALMSWHAKDAEFNDVVNGISHSGSDAIRDFYTQAYGVMPKFRITDPKTTGFTPEFVACEMKCEGEITVDLPHAGLKAGDTMRLIGVSLFWWRWEGKRAEWDGSLDEEVVRGWKIVRERSYYNFAK